MNYTVEEYSIEDNLRRLDINFPSQLAFFPENIETAKKKVDLIFTESMIELSKYFKASHVKLEVLGGDTELYRSRKNADIYLPAIFFSISVISEYPYLISVLLNIVSSFIYDNFKGTIGRKTVHVEFHIESREKGKIKKIDYKGDVEGLKNLENIIKAM